MRAAEIRGLFEETVGFWRSWLAQSTYTGRWREMINRSAITLKLMTYAPTGGLVAAPTTALPEQVGGERNWDYRYTWVRDASFSVYALMRLGFYEEAELFGVLAGRPDPGAGQQRQRPAEHHVPHRRLLGPEGGDARPLARLSRVDAGAHRQRRGRAAAAGHLRRGAGQHLRRPSRRHGDPDQGWMAIAGVLDWLAENWDQPEEGIWETRGGRQPFTYGRVMCWVAFDRGIRMAAEHGFPAPWSAGPPRGTGSTGRSWSRASTTARQAFVQHYDTDVLDSALLRMADRRIHRRPRSFVAVDAGCDGRELVTDSLVYRYNPGGLPGRPARARRAPSPCARSPTSTRWPVPAGWTTPGLAFEKMLTYANHVGLYSEEIALTGEQIGNFPQAFTHLSLIDAAISLDAALSR